MNQNITSMRSVASGFSYVMDLVSDEIQGHHKKVAYLSYRLAEHMGLPEHACRLSIMGGLLHDIGGVLNHGVTSLNELEANAVKLAKDGSNILKLLPIDTPISEIVLNSQSPSGELLELTANYNSLQEWITDIQANPDRSKIPQMSKMVGQIVHVSDVAVLLFSGEDSALNQTVKVEAGIREISKTHAFHPWVLESFYSLCRQESVWLDLLYEPDAFLEFIPDSNTITLKNMEILSEFASVIIDFQSPFTARHSAGVSATAVELAKLFGMSEDECIMIKIAGNLHDIGKLNTPTEILEKPGKLTAEEYNIMKEHAYFTWKVLNHIDGLEQILEWAAFHHEKLNGNGYPFHIEGIHLNLGARIMAVSDIFAAITEDRPYRKGMEKDKVIQILREDAERGDISSLVVETLIQNYDQVNSSREAATSLADRKYKEILSGNDDQVFQKICSRNSRQEV